MSARRTAGDQLYALLPAVYRARDEGDLRQYLAATGEVLDLLRGALDQRLVDAFPGHPDAEPWVFPYVAQLVDARLVAFDDEGRRAELGAAVRWRQRQGTIGAVHEIAATIGRFGWTATDPAQRPYRTLVVQEGWRRVAVTPRVPLPPALAPQRDRRRLLAGPSFPAVTPDLRYRARLVLPPSAPGAPDGATYLANPHGVPRFPDTAEDSSRRTPDFRVPSARAGQVHPSNILVFVAPHAGFFPPGWDRPTAPRRLVPAASTPLAVTQALQLRNAVVLGDVTLDAGDVAHVIEDTVITGTLHLVSGTLTIRGSSVGTLRADAPLGAAPAVDAEGCLFGALNAQGLVRLVSVTVLGTADSAMVWASNALFAGKLTLGDLPEHPTQSGPTRSSCLRYSRVPEDVLAAYGPSCQAHACFTAPPRFAAATLGAPGAGVLHPECAVPLREGAEDGGEVGAFRAQRLAGRARAVLDKLRDQLPIGLRAQLITDARVSHRPPIGVSIRGSS